MAERDPLNLYGGNGAPAENPATVSIKRIMTERVLVPVTLASIAYLLGFWHGRKSKKSAT